MFFKLPRLVADTFARSNRNERGQVFALVVIMLAVLGGMTAMAVDLGSYAADRRDLQNAADAIALAAAQDLPDSGAVNTAADSWQTKNEVGNAAMTVTITQQSLPNNPNPSVRVTLTRDHEFTFARLIGVTSSSVSASATAIKTSPGGIQGAGGTLMPWSVVESHKNSASPGTSLVLKYDANDPTNGNFGALRIDGSGADVYRDSITYGATNGLCATGVSDCGYPSVVQTEPGNVTGPTRTATDYRMDNADTSCDTWGEAVIEEGGKHLLRPECNPFTAGGNPWSLRVIVVPVIASLCNGACDVTVTEFALFYLEGYGAGGCSGNDCEIRGRFINSNTNLEATIGIFDSDPTTSHFVRLIE